MTKTHCDACDSVIPDDEAWLELTVIKSLGTTGVETGDALAICLACRRGNQVAVLTAIMDRFDKLELDA